MIKKKGLITRMCKRVIITLDFNQDSDVELFDKLANLSSVVEDIDDMFIRNVEIHINNDYEEK